MALSFHKKGAAAPAQQAASDTPKTPTSFGSKSASSSAPVSFLKKGAAASAAFKEAEAKAELAAAEQGKMWNFWMEPEEERQITFLDGDLDNEGMLDIYMFHEHQLNINGKYTSFICTAEVDESQPCPICTKGDSKPYLVGVMTVMDHTEHTIKKGPNAGKKVKNQRKIYKAKRNTIKKLSKQAAKRGGSLRGCTFDVTRGDDKSPNVGEGFEFVTKYDSYDAIATKYGIKVEDCQPADYAQEITYLSPEQLVELGVGIGLSGPGTEKGSSLKDQL